jgi:GNAT superfamily N-acetyltransferase
VKVLLQPEHRLIGPRQAGDDDVDVLNGMFADAFTDRYRRDGMSGVRVPRLNPQIWRYAIQDAGSGAMVWQDEHDELVGFNMVHHSGVEGWMGPLAVRTDRQGCGFGKVIVNTAVDWLRERSARAIGLETMPRTVDNIGFYAGLGFLPGHLTVTMASEVPRRPDSVAFTRLSELSPSGEDDLLEQCQVRLRASAPGYDFTREHRLTGELGIGDTVVINAGSCVRGFALWHSAALVEARSPEELRLLKLFADSTEAFTQLVGALEECAAAVGVRGVAIRCQTGCPAAYSALVRRGYQVRWTDLRMTLQGFPEIVVPEGEVLFSNWEI